MPNRLVEIDATKPVCLVEVDDVMDNAHWRFCSDDPMVDESTYEMFDIKPDDILPEGTTVRITHLWGFADLGITDPVDYQVVLTKDASMSRAVYVILSRYHADMNAMDATGRYYFVEQATNKDGVVDICLGT